MNELNGSLVSISSPSSCGQKFGAGHLVNLSFHQLAISLILSFHQLAIEPTFLFSSAIHFINLTYQLAVLFTCHGIDLPSHHFSISSTCHFGYLRFQQSGFSSSLHFINLTFHQIGISSNWHFIKLTFHHLVLSTNH
jgi:hypothetical protein